MITKFKIFEKKEAQYKKGDYVLITSDDYDFINEPMIISKNPELLGMSGTDFIIRAKMPDDIEDYSFYDYEIIRKISKKEAEMILAAKKYNIG